MPLWKCVGRGLGVLILVLYSIPGLAQLVPENTQVVDRNLGASAGLGRALVTGDFDGDGVEDVAMGAPNIGTVVILFGPLASSPGEFSLTGNGDFGRSLAVCDFNDDGFDDLVVGAPEADARGSIESGRVFVYRGGTGAQLLDQVAILDEGDAGATISSGDDFGFALATGRFFGPCSLAVGVPGESISGLSSVGAVRVFEHTGDFAFSFQKTLDADDVEPIQAGIGFGSVLQTTKFPNGAYDNLAVSAPFRTVDGVAGAGDVALYRTDLLGPRLPEAYSDPSLRSVAPSFAFGTSLASADFDGDGFEDLVLGAPYGHLSPTDTRQVGAVIVIYGSQVGGSAIRDIWTQDSLNVADVAEPFDFFGQALAAGDFDGDRFGDLAIAATGEDGFDGRVDVLYGSRSGLRGAGSQGLTETMAGGTASGERFGEILAVGDLSGNGASDLAVGLPNKDGPGVANEGLVYLVPAEDAFVDAEVLLEEGDSLDTSRGETGSITEIRAIAHDEGGRLGAHASFENGEWALLAEAEPSWTFLYDSATQPASSLDSDIEDFAFDSSNRYVVQGNRVGDQFYLVVSDNGVLAVENTLIPGTPHEYGEAESVSMVSGRAHFLADSYDPEYVLRDDGSGGVEQVIASTTWIPGDPYVNLAYDFTADGALMGVYGVRPDPFDGVARVNGAIVAEVGGAWPATRQGYAAPRGAVFWDRVTSVNVGGGAWVVSGSFEEESTAATILVSSDEALSGYGFTSGLGGDFLANRRPFEVEMNARGNVLSLWMGPTNDRDTLILSCGPGLRNHKLGIREGLRLDLDADGEGDATVRRILHFGDPPSRGGLDVLVELDYGAQISDAVVRLPGATCPLFADGFESGNTQAWTGTSR